MPGKSVPLSVRITETDAAFLSKLEMAGATTPSDKLRALLEEARLCHGATQAYPDLLRGYQDMFAPAVRAVMNAEEAKQQHSELLAHVLTWLPDLAAFVMAHRPDAESPDVEAELRTLEEGVAERLFRIIDRMLRLSVTSEIPCYDPDVVKRRVPAVIEIIKLVQPTR